MSGARGGAVAGGGAAAGLIIFPTTNASRFDGSSAAGATAAAAAGVRARAEAEAEAGRPGVMSPFFIARSARSRSRADTIGDTAGSGVGRRSNAFADAVVGFLRANMAGLDQKQGTARSRQK